MYWSGAFSMALAWGVFGPTLTCTAFTAPLPSTLTGRRLSPLNVGDMGWDNEDFLEALSRGPEAVEKANEDYRALSRFRPPSADDYEDNAAPPPRLADDELPSEGSVRGAVLTDEMKAAMKASHAEDGSQGGSMFKDMMARAQQGPRTPPPPPPPSSPPPDAQQQQMPGNFENLSVEQQAQLFRQMMQPPPAAATAAAGSNFLPPGAASDGRRYGRNKDADAIVNTSDVYIAQLKLDSTVRNIARYRGDTDFANQVFGDPEIWKIKLHENPYLEEQKKKEQELLETSPDEMLIQIVETRQQTDKSFSGVSYKAKLKQLKSKKNAPATAEPQKKLQETVSPKQENAPAAAQPKVLIQTTTESPQVEPEATVIPKQEQQVATFVTPSSTSSRSADDRRRDIRTLMGMLIKHRGGEGFGSGRLQGADVERFEALANEVMAELKQESKSTVASPSEVTESPAVAPQAPPPPSSTPSSAIPVGERINSMVACIEGSIIMYKNSPPELQEGVLMTLRAAFLSAINTLNEVPSLGKVELPPLSTQTPVSLSTEATQSGSTGGAIARAPTTPVADRINGVVSVLEGAIQMYKNSPDELQQAILFTLRASLLSGIGTLNEVISDNEAKNLEAYRTAISDPRTRSSSQKKESPKPTQFYDVIPETPKKDASPVYSGSDENSMFFEQVFAKLEKAKGNGKMGLRTDLSPSEAADLAADIADMRALLVDELDSGIPDAEDSASSDAQSPSSSKYQEMLAKARAEKDAKNS